MGWSVTIIDENGQDEKMLTDEFDIINFKSLDPRRFKLIKYLDPYGDLTISHTQLDDLSSDLRQLQAGQVKLEQITELLGLIDECKRDVHKYLKFWGD